MLQKFILALLVEAAKNPDVQKFVDDRLALVVEQLRADLNADVQAELAHLRTDLVGLLPAFGTGIIKSAFDHLPQLPVLPAAADLASSVAQNILDLGHNVPVIGQFADILKGFLR